MSIDASADDDRFVDAFLAGSLAPETFDHRAHLRAACGLLRRLPFLEACIAMRDGLTRLAARAGKPGLYHETITVASMSLVLERIARDAGDAGPGAPRDEIVDAAGDPGRGPTHDGTAVTDDRTCAPSGAAVPPTTARPAEATRRRGAPMPTDPGAAANAATGATATSDPDPGDFEALLARCPELLDRGLLGRYYRPDVLASDAARRRFVLPGPRDAAAAGRGAAQAG